jgi:hypothetical protein
LHDCSGSRKRKLIRNSLRAWRHASDFGSVRRRSKPLWRRGLNEHHSAKKDDGEHDSLVGHNSSVLALHERRVDDRDRAKPQKGVVPDVCANSGTAVPAPACHLEVSNMLRHSKLDIHSFPFSRI